MTQVINLFKNPVFATATTGAAALANTGAAGLAPVAIDGYQGGSFARETWTTATTAAGSGVALGHASTAGIPRIDIAAATLYTVSVWVRASKAKTLVLTGISYNTSAAQVGSVASAPVALTANVWTELRLAVTTPAAAARLVLQITDTDATRWLAGNTLDIAPVLVVAGADLPTFGNPNTDPRWAFTGTANQSTSYTRINMVPTIITYQPADGNPGMLVNFAELYPGAAAIRIYRSAEGRTFPVRGGAGIPADTPVLDQEVPFNVPADYTAEMFSSADMSESSSLGFTSSLTVTLVETRTIIHQPLSPSMFVVVNLHEGTAEDIMRETPGELVYADEATYPRWIGGRRQALTDLPLIFETNTHEQADMMQQLTGAYEMRMPAVLCVRTPGPAPRIPRMFFAAFPRIIEHGISVDMGGSLIRWPLTVNEALPPATGLASSPLSYDDIDYYYGDNDLADAAYIDYQARDTDFSLAGTAP